MSKAYPNFSILIPTPKTPNGVGMAIAKIMTLCETIVKIRMTGLWIKVTVSNKTDLVAVRALQDYAQHLAGPPKMRKVMNVETGITTEYQISDEPKPVES